MASRAIARQAVVIGAGIAGLAAARALSDHFEQVVVLERDPLSDGPAHRSGTPQSRHAHGLLVGDSVHSARYFQASSRTLLKRVPYWSKRVSTFGSSGQVMTRFHNVTLVW